MEQDGSVETMHDGCNTDDDDDDSTSLSSRSSCPRGPAGRPRLPSSENSEFSSISEIDNRRTSPSVFPNTAAAVRPGALGGGCVDHVRGDAKLSAVRSFIDNYNAPMSSRRAWEGGDEEDIGVSTSPPHSRAAATTRQFDGAGCSHISPDNDGPRLSMGSGGIVDVRSFHDVDAATDRVMALLRNVRRLATLRDVVILTEESVNRSQGALRTALRMAFHERNIRFVDNVAYLQVDAFSGTWDDDYGEDCNYRYPSNNIRRHRDEPHPSESDALLKGRLRSYRREGESSTRENGVLDHPSVTRNGTFEDRPRFYPPSPGSSMVFMNNLALMATQEMSLQGIVTSHSDSASQLHGDGLPQIHHRGNRPPRHSNEDTNYAASSQRSRFSNEDVNYTVPSRRSQLQETSIQYAHLPFVQSTSTRHPPFRTALPAADQALPQDQGTMLIYNPYDPIEHALQFTAATKTTMSPLFIDDMKMSSAASGASSDPYHNAVGDKIHHRRDDFSMSSIGHSEYRGVGDNVARRSSPPAAAAAATPASLLPKRYGHSSHGQLSSDADAGLAPPRVICIHHHVHTDSDVVHVVSSDSSPSTFKPSSPQNQTDGGIRRGQDCGKTEIQRAISESQATHIAHTRQQVADDIKFRRSLELASIESARNLCVEERLLSESKKCEAELELALRQSEHIYAMRQQEEERVKASEEQLIADLLLRTRIEEENAQREEEEMLSRTLVVSLKVDRNVIEEELLAEAIMRSINESAPDPNSQDEIVERVLKLSWEEQLKMDEEEEEHIRKAIRHSMSDMTRW